MAWEDAANMTTGPGLARSRQIGLPDGQNHELLHGKGVSGVASTVDDVEGGHGQDLPMSQIQRLVNGEAPAHMASTMGTW